MESDRSRNYKLVDLRDHPEVIRQITEAEQKLNQMIGEDVALIAYVRKQ
ncbi:hypothetical protein CLV97_105119 [Planifilum fimeticola]|jgi:hypothetical protein|uniref:Uncharacterized protein n=1 Tax=Planifilum fimeticola TaxID=201975 RepID=A0A2T0LH86_9BACL|nr:hypothetical protein [Planifilum fimeticola]PRX41688.1 hypothetical protein CLV97_105119 [Planifilum fimeticola]